MIYRTALLEFATMLKVGTAALQGLTDRESPTPQTDEVAELLREADAIADRLTKLSDALQNGATK